MRIHWKSAIALGSIVVTVLLGSKRLGAAEPAPDNSAVNARDTKGGEVTPLDQSNNPQDVELTKKIRRAVTSDSGMSIDARNIKIIAVKGVVVLRGPVRSQEEKAKILEIASQIAGPNNVDNQIEVIPEKNVSH